MEAFFFPLILRCSSKLFLGLLVTAPVSSVKALALLPQFHNYIIMNACGVVLYTYLFTAFCIDASLDERVAPGWW